LNPGKLSYLKRVFLEMSKRQLMFFVVTVYAVFAPAIPENYNVAAASLTV